jgi:hypothetical protein
MRKHHVYHLYANGFWEQAWKEHVIALNMGLLRELDTFSVGLVGTNENRAIARKVVEEVGATVVVEEDSGYEQVTLNWLHNFAFEEEGVVLYAHSKGSGFPNRPSTLWRRTMTFDAVVDWRKCVETLEKGFNCTGSNWHPACPQWGPTPYFAGNFWWATLDLIKSLNLPANTTRYDAETWIGESPVVNPFPKNNGPYYTLPINDGWLSYFSPPEEIGGITPPGVVLGEVTR